MFWAERVTVRRSVGSSPYFLAHGVLPTLPIDLEEATYLLPPPDSVLSTTDLLAQRARELQKRLEDLEAMWQRVFTQRKDWVARLELEHASRIRNFDFQPGSLVLAWNTQVEKTFVQKNHM